MTTASIVLHPTSVTTNLYAVVSALATRGYAVLTPRGRYLIAVPAQPPQQQRVRLWPVMWHRFRGTP